MWITLLYFWQVLATISSAKGYEFRVDLFSDAQSKRVGGFREIDSPGMGLFLHVLSSPFCIGSDRATAAGARLPSNSLSDSHRSDRNKGPVTNDRRLFQQADGVSSGTPTF